MATLILFCFSYACAWAQEPTYEFTGEITGADHQTYKEIPFDVPPNTARITVDFSYTGKEHKTVVDLGLLDPNGLRGWSGGNKNWFTISETDATPSYSTGKLIPGKWQLLLGFPNVRSGSHDTYRARIWVSASEETIATFRPVLSKEPGWFVGDLHSHTGHSDGTCESKRKQKIPCPVFVTAEAAHAAGLDFIAITDHNNTSHFPFISEIQPYFDDLLLIRGREVTTFYGHANLYGTSEDVNFRIQADPQSFSTFQAEAFRPGSLLSINHPGIPSGEWCMGCGWQHDDLTDFSKVGAVEVVNGSDVETVISGIPISGIPFWERQLDRGFRLTAISGSDNHQPDTSDTRKQVGYFSTVVYAKELSEPAVLAAIKSGLVYLTRGGKKGPAAALTCELGGQTLQMGDTVNVSQNTVAHCSLTTARAKDMKVQIVINGKPTPAAEWLDIGTDNETVKFDVPVSSESARVRVNLRSEGELVALTNPVYFNY